MCDQTDNEAATVHFVNTVKYCLIVLQSLLDNSLAKLGEIWISIRTAWVSRLD